MLLSINTLSRVISSVTGAIGRVPTTLCSRSYAPLISLWSVMHGFAFVQCMHVPPSSRIQTPNSYPVVLEMVAHLVVSLPPRFCRFLRMGILHRYLREAIFRGIPRPLGRSGTAWKSTHHKGGTGCHRFITDFRTVFTERDRDDQSVGLPNGCSIQVPHFPSGQGLPRILSVKCDA